MNISDLKTRYPKTADLPHSDRRVNRVAMRKLSSTKNFDLHIWWSRGNKRHKERNMSLTEANQSISVSISSLSGTNLHYVGKGVFEDMRGILKNRYIVMDEFGDSIHIEISVNRNNLSMEDLDQVLKLGLEIERHIK